MYRSSHPNTTLGDFVLHYVSLPIDFQLESKADFESSLVFNGISEKEKRSFERLNLTINLHDYAVDPETIRNDSRSNDFWKITSLSYLP